MEKVEMTYDDFFQKAGGDYFVSGHSKGNHRKGEITMEELKKIIGERFYIIHPYPGMQNYAGFVFIRFSDGVYKSWYHYSDSMRIGVGHWNGGGDYVVKMNREEMRKLKMEIEQERKALEIKESILETELWGLI